MSSSQRKTLKGVLMTFLLILIGFLNLPLYHPANTCNVESNELCCTWSYDICDIQPTKEELKSDPDLNKTSERWCFDVTTFSWKEDPGDWDMEDDHEAFLKYASPEELRRAKDYWENGD